MSFIGKLSIIIEGISVKDLFTSMQVERFLLLENAIAKGANMFRLYGEKASGGHGCSSDDAIARAQAEFMCDHGRDPHFYLQDEKGIQYEVDSYFYKAIQPFIKKENVIVEFQHVKDENEEN